MKRVVIAAMVMMVAAGAWALTLTGMPFLDDLRADVAKKGPISQKLGFSDEQREKIQSYIDDKSEELVKKRDALVAAEKKLERKENKKKPGKKEAKENKDDAFNELNAAREEAFAGLKAYVTDAQFEGLKQWRAAGKANAR